MMIVFIGKSDMKNYLYLLLELRSLSVVAETIIRRVETRHALSLPQQYIRNFGRFLGNFDS